MFIFRVNQGIGSSLFGNGAFRQFPKDGQVEYFVLTSFDDHENPGKENYYLHDAANAKAKHIAWHMTEEWAHDPVHKKPCHE